MPLSTQATVYPWATPKAGALGQGRNQTNLEAAFSASPMYGASAVLTKTGVEEFAYQIFNGSETHEAVAPFANITANGDGAGTKQGVVNDGGYMFGQFDLNYGTGLAAPDDLPKAPDVSKVRSTENGDWENGDPSSPYVPNLTADNNEEYLGNMPTGGSEYGVGLGYTANPYDTSFGISGGTIGSYIKGPIAGGSRSYDDSAGGS